MTQIKGVPVYELYGERTPWPTPDMVHCESIASRSRRHNWHIKPHRHAGLFQVLWLEQGEALVRLDEAEQAMAPGDVLAVPQGCIHGFRFQRDTCGYVVTAAYPLLLQLARLSDTGIAALARPVLHHAADAEEAGFLRMAFGAIDREYRGNARHREQMLETLLASVLIVLSRRVRAPAAQGEHARGSRHFENFHALVEQWYDTHRPLAEYARQLGITAAHLNLLCRRQAGKSALEVIHERLLVEAKRNLVYTSMTISEVSYAIGFSDPAYFTRFFKRMAGVSPRAFRQRAERIAVEA